MVEITERPNESGFRQRRYAGEIRRARANRETVRIKATIQTHALEFGVRPVQACTSTVLLRGSVVWMAAAGGGQLSGSVQEKPGCPFGGRGAAATHRRSFPAGELRATVGCPAGAHHVTWVE